MPRSRTARSTGGKAESERSAMHGVEAYRTAFDALPPLTRLMKQ
ncbi:hypothetical protein [Sphingobium lactosutens]|nr:hypothetical protein [Sphingobium lactosutens]